MYLSNHWYSEARLSCTQPRTVEERLLLQTGCAIWWPLLVKQPQGSEPAGLDRYLGLWLYLVALLSNHTQSASTSEITRGGSINTPGLHLRTNEPDLGDVVLNSRKFTFEKQDRKGTSTNVFVPAPRLFSNKIINLLHI